MKGNVVHGALETMFRLPPADRAANLHEQLRDAWRVGRMRPENAALFATVAEEREWGLQCLHLLDNYLRYENPSQLVTGEPLSIEGWLSAELSDGSSPPVTMVGRLDRMDAAASPAMPPPSPPSTRTVSEMQAAETASETGVEPKEEPEVDMLSFSMPSVAEGVVIIDYKTGKPPPQKYSRETNERIRRDNLFQLRCYALLLQRGGPPKGFDRRRARPAAQTLRLLYLADAEDGDGSGATPVEEVLPPIDSPAYEQVLAATEAEVLGVWRQVATLVEADDPLAFQPCKRAFCQCHDIRPIVFSQPSGPGSRPSMEDGMEDGMEDSPTQPPGATTTSLPPGTRTQAKEATKKVRPSETDDYDTAADKLAHRMREGTRVLLEHATYPHLHGTPLRLRSAHACATWRLHPRHLARVRWTGMFSVVDVDEPDFFSEGPSMPTPYKGAYVIKPERGGMRYLRNVAGRLQEIGFALDPATNTWVRWKVLDGQQMPRLNLETLHDELD